VRRNSLADFKRVNRNGKIAMKLDDGDALIGVSICNPEDNVFLTTHQGQCIRFDVGDVRVFAGRNSTGVRGIRLQAEDRVISMSILQGGSWTSDQRDAYLRYAAAVRRGDEAVSAEGLTEDQIALMTAQEQFLLTITERGFGKRSSSFEYRVTGRGGKGIANIEMSERNGKVAASFPVLADDEIIMVTDGGQLIRTKVDQIRIAGRKTQGVTVFRVSEGENVVSVSCFSDMGEDEDASETLEAATGEDQSPAPSEANAAEEENTPASE